jgi:hypothetical protein
VTSSSALPLPVTLAVATTRTTGSLSARSCQSRWPCPGPAPAAATYRHHSKFRLPPLALRLEAAEEFQVQHESDYSEDTPAPYGGPTVDSNTQLLNALLNRTRLDSESDRVKLARAKRGVEAAQDWDTAFLGRQSITAEKFRKLGVRRIIAALRMLDGTTTVNPPRSDDVHAMWQAFPAQDFGQRSDYYEGAPKSSVRGPSSTTARTSSSYGKR